jgi:hypothetical protein
MPSPTCSLPPSPLIASLININQEGDLITTEYSQHIRAIFDQGAYTTACNGLENIISSHINNIQNLCEKHYAV